MKSIAEIIGGAQSLLDIDFELQSCFEEYLTDEYKTFLHILSVVETYIQEEVITGLRMGRPAEYHSQSFIRSELAKRYFHIEKTKDLIERLKNDPNLRLLCGFKKVPHKSSFSRKLALLSEQPVFENALNALVKEAHKETIVYHTSRDSTAIPAREKPEKKSHKKDEKPKKKHGRPPKSAVKPPSVLETQISESPQQSLEKIDKKCAWGCKKNSEGNVSFWKGYKLHLDVSDIGFPLTACVTGANVHDSRLAIPMEKLTEQKVTFLYSLMDAGYDAAAIDKFIRGKGRIPIIAPNMRKNKNRAPLDPAKKERFKIRTTVERSNSDLKDNYIPKAIYVKGFRKVSFVLMSAVLCLASVKYLLHFIL